MSSTTPEPTADVAQESVDAQSPCQVLIKAVQIDLDRPRYMNYKVYIRTNREEIKSKCQWSGFRKRSTINWDLNQPCDVSQCNDIKILWRIRFPLQKNNPCKTTILTKEDIESITSQNTGTGRDPGTAIKREYKCRDGKCNVMVSFIVRDDPCWTAPASTVQNTVVNAPEDPQPAVPADISSVIEQVPRFPSSVSQTQMVESAEELQANTPSKPLPVSTSSLVPIREGIAQAIRAPDHIPGDARLQTSSSQPVPRAKSEHVSFEDIQEGPQPDAKHDTAEGVAKDQQPTALSDILHEAATDAEQIKSIRDRLRGSVDILEGIKGLSDFISELHPAIGISIVILTGVIKILDVEDARNKEIIELITSMSDIVDYVIDVEQFATVAQLKAVIGEANELMRKAVEFFKNHKQRGTLKKVFAALSPRAKKELEELQGAFSQFKEKFNRGIALQATVGISNLESKLRTLVRANEDNEVLKSLDTKHATRHLRCLEGTREDLILLILEWARNFAESISNILWIYGYPGAGKSTLAMHIAEIFCIAHRLGVIVEFNRTTGVTPVILWKTVAYALACEYPVCREVIVSELKGGTLNLANATSSDIFERLVAEPLRRLTASGNKISPDRLPVVVIDALDECGGFDSSSRHARKEILNCVAQWAKLAPGVKLIITSRAEQDIRKAFSTISHTPLEIHTGKSVTMTSTSDIQVYMKDEFKRIANDNEITADWPGDGIVTDLSRRAEGIFIWATTVMKFIDDGVPTRQLKVILNERLPSGNVYGLYRQILESSFPQTYSLECFRKVVSAVIVAQQQFTPTELGELLGLEVDEINDIRKRLRTVLDDVDVVRFKHQSFVDFLLSTSTSDPTACPERFCINIVDAHGLMFESLFRLMNKTLRFNICQIPSSFLRNDQLPSGHFESVISRPLAYACRFWGSHLENFESDVNVDLVNTFIHEHFLSWLEVLSVHQSLSDATRFLTCLVDRLPSTSEQSAYLKDLIVDAIAFIGFCVQGIVVSASHIYTSALAFAPESSKIAQLYAPRFRNVMDLDVGRLDKWPAKQIVIPSPTSIVNFVAFSPDGRQVVSCSRDNTICIWDVETGQITAGPFKGHPDQVICVVYSTDGKNILSASADGTIRTWNTECGVVDGPVESVTVPIDNNVYRAAFSHNRKYIAWACSDELDGNYVTYISVHDIETGSTVVSDAFVGWITCLAFSPDDEGIASGSSDGTIYVLSTQTGKLVAGPFEEHQEQVECISYSHNGTFIVSGSYDDTIRLWEVGRTPPQKWVHEAHDGLVHSVAFSSDDRRIISVSGDWAVRVCDVKTGKEVEGPHRGHVGGIHSVAISPDGRHLASASFFNTIRIWDVKADRGQGGFLDGHYDINCLALSNDRRHVVSGSNDGKILYWDVGSGELVGSPCKGDGVVVSSVAYSPDGERVVSGSDNGTVRILEVASGRIEMELRGHGGDVLSVTFSNNGRYIASTSWDKAKRIWDAETGNCIHILQEGREVRSRVVSWSLVSFSPDDKYVLFAWENGFRIWDVETGNLVTKSEQEQEHDDDVSTMTFSHDGKLVATGSCDNNIRLWNATTGEPILGPFIGHTGSISCVAFSPDDKFIVSSSWDKTVRVWDVSTGQSIMGPLRGHTQKIDLVAFSHDGKYIFSVSSEDKTIRVWSTEQIQSTLFTNESKVYDNGWVKGKNGQLLFWVPVCHRLSLHRPNNTRVVGPNETRINLTNARLGDKWSECYTP